MVTTQFFLENEIIYQSESFISNPNISVILPTYCRGNNGLLKRAIDSVLNQTYTNFELIVVDDGSFDNTQAIMKEYILVDNRVKYIRNNENSGLPALRVNQGLMHARGTYFAYQFDDDVWILDMLEKLYQKITTSTCDFVYGKTKVYSRDGLNDWVLGQEFQYYQLIEQNRFANNAVLHHRVLIEKYGMYDCHLMLRRLCDWDLWLRYGKEATILFLDEFVTEAYLSMENSIGETCTYDLSIFRIFQSVDRNERLKIENFREYKLDDISFVPNPQFQYNKHIHDWFLKRRFLFKMRPENVVGDRIQTIVVTKESYDSTVDITIRNFAKLLRHKYRFVFVPDTQLDDMILSNCSLLILHRCISKEATEQLKNCRGIIPTIYFLDDDLLNLYNWSSEYAFLSPGTDYYKNLTYQLSNVDLVVSFSEKITEEVRLYNNRIVQLSTNILEQYCESVHGNTDAEISIVGNRFQLNTSPTLDMERPFRIGFIGGSARKDELNFILDDLTQISNKYKEGVAFYFWGFTPEKIDDIKESIVHKELYSVFYYEYLNRLKSFQFDLILVPLFEEKTKLAKSPIKYLEGTVNGAIGLYSDVLPYNMIEDGIHGFKVENQKGKWFEAIERAIQLSPKERKEMVERNKIVLKEMYTTESQLDRFEMMLQSAKLLHNIGRDGTIGYVVHSAFLGGTEKQILYHARLAKMLQIHVIVMLPDYFKDKEEMIQKICKEENIQVEYGEYLNYIEPYSINFELAKEHSVQFERFIENNNIKLLHCTTLIPAVSIAAYHKKIPLVNSLHAVELEDKPILNIHYFPYYIHSSSVYFCKKWAELWRANTVCVRSWISSSFFHEQRKLNYGSEKIRFAISGTLQQRKAQHRAIEAVCRLHQEGYNVELLVLGYDQFFPDYVALCKGIAIQYHCVDKIHFKGFCENMVEELKGIDALINVSEWESFPQSLLEAMAMSIPVISTPVTGVPELVIDEMTGFLIEDYTIESIYNSLVKFVQYFNNDSNKIEVIRKRAFQVVKEECNETIVSQRLFQLYNRALESNKLK